MICLDEVAKRKTGNIAIGYSTSGLDDVSYVRFTGFFASKKKTAPNTADIARVVKAVS